MILDVCDTKIKNGEIEGYFWPLAHKDLIGLRSRLLEETRDLIRKNLPQEDWHILHIVYIEIVCEMMVLMRSAKLLEVCGEKTIKASEKHFPYLNAMKRHESLLPIVRKRLGYLSKGIGSPPKYLRPLRRIKFILDRSIFVRKTVRQISPKDIVAFSSSKFMERHAVRLKEQGTRVVLSSFWEWYDLDISGLPSLSGGCVVLNEAQKTLLARLREVCTEVGYPFSDDIQAALELQAFMLCDMATFYRRHLLQEERRKYLPKTLWFGSANEMRARVLRATVQETGGYTIGHDHGRGFAMAVTEGELGTVFDFCDELTVYSGHVAEQITRHQDKKFLNLEQRKVRFTGLDNALILSEDIQGYRNKHERLQGAKPTVMFMAGIFKGEHYVGLNTLPPDITFLDFQMRVVRQFCEMGYRVLIKAHPESTLSYPSLTFEGQDVEIIGGYIEDRIQEVDLIVFDFLSSPFKTLVMTQMPMIYFDFGYSDMVGDMESHLKSRLSVVKGTFDTDNRAQIDWNSLGVAVDEAKKRAQDVTLLANAFGVTEAK